MPTQRLVSLFAAFAFGLAVAYVVLTARAKPLPPESATNANTITILQPDSDSPTGRRTVRLRRIPLADVPRHEDTSVAMPPDGWVLDVGGVTYYGVP
jgi:hypothetical protein